MVTRPPRAARNHNRYRKGAAPGRPWRRSARPPGGSPQEGHVMYFNQIAVPGLGCLSYVIGCPRAKAMAVVDPKRDIQDYLNIARRVIPLHVDENLTFVNRAQVTSVLALRGED
jgi:hypothetical protein